jgi:hypothetical protein
MSKIAIDFYIRVLQFSSGISARTFGVRQLAAALPSVASSSSPRKVCLRPTLARKEIPFLEFVLTL